MKWTLFELAAFMSLLGNSHGAAADPVLLQMEPWRRSVAVRAEVAGNERLFQFDTASGVSLISPALAKELGCERGAHLVGFRMTGEKLETPRCDNVPIRIGGHAFTIPVAGVLETASLASKDAANTTDGIIGLDIFAGRTITLDFAGGEIVVETPESSSARISGAVELPARLGREIGGRALAVYVDVPSRMGALAFEIDSGNGGTILVGKPYAEALGIDPKKGPQSAGIALGGGLVAKGLIILADITLDGNLGMPFLKDYLVTLDLDRGRAWFRKNPVGPPPGMGVPPPLPKD